MRGDNFVESKTRRPLACRGVGFCVFLFLVFFFRGLIYGHKKFIFARAVNLTRDCNQLNLNYFWTGGTRAVLGVKKRWKLGSIKTLSDWFPSYDCGLDRQEFENRRNHFSIVLKSRNDSNSTRSVRHSSSRKLNFRSTGTH